MAPPPETTDPAPSPDHKKKKKKRLTTEGARQEANETQGGGEERSEGINGVKKKKKKRKRAHGDAGEEERAVTDLPASGQRSDPERGGEERSEGINGVKKKKKKKKKERLTPEETRANGEEGGGQEEMTKKKRKKTYSWEEPEVQALPTWEEPEVQALPTWEEPEVQALPTWEEPEVLEVQTPPTKKKRDETPKKKKKRKGNEEPQPRDHRAPPAGDALHDTTESPHHRLTEAELLELEEFIPDVRSKAADVVLKIKRYDLPRLRELKQQGLKVRWGRYTRQENLQIRRNVEDLMKLTGIESADELFFPSRHPDREQSLKNLRAQHSFYQKLAEGLQRTSEQVYIRGKKIFDKRNNRGRFSEEEVTALQRLHTIHGNDWKTISNKLDRSIYACEKRCSKLGCDRGPWSEEEVQRFHRTVKKHLKLKLKAPSGSSPAPTPGPSALPGPSWVQLCTNLPWTKISIKVKSRSALQCRVKWFTYLKSRLKAAQPKEIPGFSIQTRIKLIQILYQQEVEDVFELDWVDIAKSVGGVTPVCAQRIFHRMKVSRVPGWTSMTFSEIVDALFVKELPELQKKLQSTRAGLEPGLEPGLDPGPDHFSLDQIFPKSHEEFLELDNT